MPAAGTEGVGVKLVTINPSNPDRGAPLIHAQYVLFDRDSLAPVAVLDGSALTALRTASVSALATRHLAREDAATLVLFGAGVQARAHLASMLAVRSIRKVTVVSRSTERASALVGEARSTDLDAEVGDAAAVRDAHVVCTCTTSSEPLFEGGDLQPGAHVNAVGAYRPETRELDTEAVRRARVVVESREAAFEEAGDILIPIEEGAIDRAHVVADLGDVVRGATVRRSPEDVTVFKSVGVAFEDLVVAAAVMERLEER